MKYTNPWFYFLKVSSSGFGRRKMNGFKRMSWNYFFLFFLKDFVQQFFIQVVNIFSKAIRRGNYECICFIETELFCFFLALILITFTFYRISTLSHFGWIAVGICWGSIHDLASVEKTHYSWTIFSSQTLQRCLYILPWKLANCISQVFPPVSWRSNIC